MKETTGEQALRVRLSVFPLVIFYTIRDDANKKLSMSGIYKLSPVVFLNINILDLNTANLIEVSFLSCVQPVNNSLILQELMTFNNGIYSDAHLLTTVTPFD